MTRVVLARHHRLVVTHNESADTTVVLGPPDTPPETILAVASLVLPGSAYDALARLLTDGADAVGGLDP